MKFCTNCGASVPDDHQFCTSCGKPVAAAPAQQAEAAPQQPQAAPPPEAPRPVYTQPQQQPQQQPQRPAYQQTPYAAGQPYGGQQAGYGQAPRQPYANMANARPPQGSRYAPLGIGSYIGMFFLFAIPVVGFVFMIVWACGGVANENKRSYARASLIMMAIAVVIGLVAYFVGARFIRELLYLLY